MATIKDYRIRIEADLEPLEKSLANVGKLFDQMSAGVLKAVGDSQTKIRAEIVATDKARASSAKAAQKSAKDTAKVAQDASKKTTQVKIDETADVIAASKDVADATEKAAKKSLDVSKAEGKAKFDAIDERIQAEIELEGKKLKKIEAILKEELKRNVGNQTAILKAREKASKSVAAIGKKVAGLEKKLSGALGRPADELAENFSALSESLQKGDIAGAAAFIGQSMSKSFGKAAGVIGVIVDLLKGFIDFIGEATEAAKEFNSALGRVAGVAEIEIAGAQYEKLQDQLLAIARPASVSATELAKVAQQVAAFKTPDEIAETTEQIIQLSKLDPEVPLENITAGIGRLGETLGDTGEAADILAQLTKNLTGKVTDPLGEALIELGTAASKAAVVIKDPAEAAKQSAAILSGLTETTLQLSESTTGVEEIFLKLNDAMTDPALLDTIAKGLPDGLSLIDAGFKDGEVDAVKFIDVIQKGGKAGKDLAATLGSTAGEALQFLQASFENGGKSVADFAAEFDNVAGAAASSAALLVPVADRLAAAATQARDDAFLTFGQNFTQGLDLANEGVTQFFDFLSNPNINFGPFESIIDLFVDSGVVAEKARNQYQEAAAIADATAGVVSNLNAVINDPLTTGEERLNAINQNIEGLRNVAPGTAAEIEKLQSAIAEGDPAALERADTLLKQIQDSTAFEAIDALNTALVASQELVNDLAEDSAGFFATLASDAAGFFGDIAGPLADLAVDVATLGTIDTDFDFSIDSDAVLGELSDTIDEQITESADKVQTLEDAYAQATKNQAALAEQAAAGVEGAEEAAAKALAERRKVASELNDARLDAQGLDANRAKLVEQVSSALKDQLSLAEDRAKREGEAFDAAEEMQQLLDAQGTLLATQPEIYAEIEASLKEQLKTQGEITGETEGQNAEVEKRISLEDELARLSEQQATALTQQRDLLRESGVEDTAAGQRKLADLRAQQAGNQSLLQSLRNQLAVVKGIATGNITRAEGLQQIAELEKNIGDLKAGTTDIVLEIQPIDTSSLEAQTKSIEEQIKVAERFNDELDLTIAELEESEEASKEEREATLKGIRAGESFTKAQQDAKKATDKSTKATDTKGAAELQAAKDVTQGVAEREKAENELVVQRQEQQAELHAAMLQHENALAATRFSDTLRRNADERAASARRQEAFNAETDALTAGFFDIIKGPSGSIAGTGGPLTPEDQLADLQAFSTRAAGAIDAALAAAVRGSRVELEQWEQDIRGAGVGIDVLGDGINSLRRQIEEARRDGTLTPDLEEAGRQLDQFFTRGPNTAILESFANIKEQSNVVAGTFRAVDAAILKLIDSGSPEEFAANLATLESLQAEAESVSTSVFGIEEALARTQAIADLQLLEEDDVERAEQLRQIIEAAPTGLQDLTGGMQQLGFVSTETLGRIKAQGVEIAKITEEIDAATKAETEALTVAEKRVLIDQQRIDLEKEIALLQQQRLDAEAGGNQAFADSIADSINGLEEQKKALDSLTVGLDTLQTLEDEVLEGLSKEKFEGFLSQFQDVFGQIEGIVDIAAGIPDLVTEMAGQFRTGDVAGGISNIADLTTQVGQALLSSGIQPLQVAGAILLGVGLVGKAIAAIAALFQTINLTNVQIAQMESDKEERLRDLMEARVELAKELAAAGDKRFDQATEELALIREQNEELRRQSELARELSGLSSEDLGARQDALETRRAETEAAIALLEQEKDRLNRFELGDLLLDEFGLTEAELGIDSVDAALALLDEMEGDLIGINSQIAAGTAEMEARTNEIEAQNEVIEQQIDLNNLLVRLGASELDAARETARLRKQQLTDDLDRILETDAATKALAESFGVLDGESLAELSDEDLREFIRQAAALDLEQITGETAGLANGWIDAADAATTLAGAVEDLFDRQKQLLVLQRDLEEITQEEFVTRTVNLLEERLGLLEAEGDELVTQGAAESEILDNQIARMEIELEIRNLLAEQNAELGETDTILTGLIRKNQQRIRDFRAQQAGGNLTGAQIAELEGIRQEAVARLTENGATPEDIQAFLDSLPKFEEGGATSGGPIMSHPGEFVLRRQAVDSIGLKFLEDLNRAGADFVNTQAPGNSDAGRFLQSTLSGGSTSSVDVGGISVTLNVTSSDPDRAAENVNRAFVPALEAEIISIVNRGLEAGTVDTRR